MPRKALGGFENCRLYSICHIDAIGGDIGSNVVKIVEGCRRESIGWGHLSGNQPLCPPFTQDASSLIRVHKFAALRLGKPLCNVCGNSVGLREHPVPIPMLFADHRERLVEQLIRAHPRPGGPIKYLLLLGF